MVLDWNVSEGMNIVSLPKMRQTLQEMEELVVEMRRMKKHAQHILSDLMTCQSIAHGILGDYKKRQAKRSRGFFAWLCSALQS